MNGKQWYVLTRDAPNRKIQVLDIRKEHRISDIFQLDSRTMSLKKKAQ